MNSQTQTQQTFSLPRRSTWTRWTLALAFGLLSLLSLIALTVPAQAASPLSTIPPQNGETELVGPIDQIVSSSEWIVAGIPVHLTAATRVDERVAVPAPGGWAKVEGQGDGAGGMNAQRIKILPVLPQIKLKGPLTALSSAAVEVDAISIPLSTTTRIVGDPQPGVDRVSVRADRLADNSLLASRVQKEGAADLPPSDPEEDQPDPRDGVQLYGTIGSRPNGDVGLWTVSGVPVSVTLQTALVDRVGPLVAGAWVQVQGKVDNRGQLVARRIRTVSQRSYHRVSGPLDGMTATDLRVGGIYLKRDVNTKVEGNPTVGKPVEVNANLLLNDSLMAVKIKSDKGEQEDSERHTVEFVGRVESLPAGTLFGEWMVAGRRVIVTESITNIDEHKGLIAVDVLVKVEGTRNQDGSINALEIDVKRGEGEENQPGEDHQFVRLVGVIAALPADGLLGDWTVDGKTVVVTERTELGHTPTFVVSDTVKVKGYAQSDGSVIAREIEKENEDEQGGGGGEGQEVKWSGPIGGLPANGLLGEWMVDGKPVRVNEQTELKDAGYAVGDVVQVEGRRQPNGPAIAKKIEKRSGDNGQEVQFSGEIEKLPSHGLLGEWTVDDKTVKVTPQTNLKENAYSVGDTVQVKGTQQQSGIVIAKKIEKDE